MDSSMQRRDFLAVGAVALGAGVLGMPLAQAAEKTPSVCVFSKHLQYLDYPALAKACKTIGLDGVDLTVRNGGHVEPRKVKEDLPKAVAAIRDAGLEVSMITTRIQSGKRAETKRVLETAAEEGIRYYRIGGHKYGADDAPLERLAEVSEDLKSLADLNEKLDMVAGYHNHSGMGYVGAPVWDLLHVYEAVGSPTIGSNLDMGHLLVEGAYGDWHVTARALAAHTHMMAAKDFVFEGRKPRWVPLGQGVAPFKELLTIMRDRGFNGPISLHFEYREFHQLSDAKKLDEIRAAADVLRENMAQAGYALA